MYNYEVIEMFRELGEAVKHSWDSPKSQCAVIAKYAETVESQMFTNGCNEPHIRPVRVSYFEPGYAEFGGYRVTLYAYYDAEGNRLTPAFDHRWDAMIDLIYRYGDMSAQALRWTDTMSACVKLNIGEQAMDRKASAIKERLEQALMLLANPLPLTETLVDDSHLVPLF